MGDMDLIPRRYRELQRVRRWLSRFAAAMILLMLAMGLARYGLTRLAHEEQQAVSRVMTSSAATRAQGLRAAELNAEKAELMRQLDRLGKMREGSVSSQVLVAVDEALNDRIWFDELTYVRSISMPRPAGADKGTSPAADLQAVRRVEIKGKALDHAALADFLGALSARPEFAEVQTTSTSVRRYTSTNVVEFAVEAQLKPGALRS